MTDGVTFLLTRDHEVYVTFRTKFIHQGARAFFAEIRKTNMQMFYGVDESTLGTKIVSKRYTRRLVLSAVIKLLSDELKTRHKRSRTLARGERKFFGSGIGSGRIVSVWHREPCFLFYQFFIRSPGTRGGYLWDVTR